MKTKVVQHVDIYLYRVNERVKVVKVARVKIFQNIPGSQLLSDIQTFFLKN